MLELRLGMSLFASYVVYLVGEVATRDGIPWGSTVANAGSTAGTCLLGAVIMHLWTRRRRDGLS